MLTDNSIHSSAEPSHLDIARTARSLIIQRDRWRKNIIGEDLRPEGFSNLSAKQKQDMAGWIKEQDHLKTIAEERTDKAIEKLPEQDRQTAKENVQKLLAGKHDKELERPQNNAPYWSNLVSSPLGQDMTGEAMRRAQAEKENPGRSSDDRSGQITFTQRTKDQVSHKDDPGGRAAHKAAIEQNIRTTPPPPPIGRDKDKD